MQDLDQFAITNTGPHSCWIKSPIVLEVITKHKIFHVKHVLTDDINILPKSKQTLSLEIRGTGNVFDGQYGRLLPPVKALKLKINNHEYPIQKTGYDAKLTLNLSTTI